MTVSDIQGIMAVWAPPAIAWKSDNPGLQCGDPAQRVRGILVVLEATVQTVAEARRRRANLIISHHPLLFRPLRSVTPSTAAGRVLKDLLSADIALYSAHTNLDFTRGGTSFALADLLKLKDVQFLESPYKIHRKIVTFVPAPQVDRVASAMAEAGAGRIGNYDECSFQTSGTGTFRGNDASHPALGNRGKREQVREVRLEMLVPEWSVERVLSAMRREHPYEEVAFDIYPLENRSADYGMGVVGTLRPPVTLARFLRQVKRALGTGALRWTGNPAARVERVAACGGSGGELLEAAIRSKADVFVTADVKYHSFHDASGSIALVDAGHFETEAPVLGAVVHHLKEEFQRRRVRIPVYPAARSTNPVRYE
jgi:dinuclear metal center YbgI/SA1388 family protein